MTIKPVLLVCLVAIFFFLTGHRQNLNQDSIEVEQVKRRILLCSKLCIHWKALDASGDRMADLFLISIEKLCPELISKMVEDEYWCNQWGKNYE